MYLALKVDDPPVPRTKWHSSEAKDRAYWREVYESISAWFCNSNDFRKENDCVIFLPGKIIELKGAFLRYLSPSLRSVASLVYNAHVNSEKISHPETIETSPGVFVHPLSKIELPQPHVQILFGLPSVTKPSIGTLFGFAQSGTQSYYAPATHLNQAIIWMLNQ